MSKNLTWSQNDEQIKVFLFDHIDKIVKNCKKNVLKLWAKMTKNVNTVKD